MSYCSERARESRYRPIEGALALWRTLALLVLVIVLSTGSARAQRDADTSQSRDDGASEWLPSENSDKSTSEERATPDSSSREDTSNSDSDTGVKSDFRSKSIMDRNKNSESRFELGARPDFGRVDAAKVTSAMQQLGISPNEALKFKNELSERGSLSSSEIEELCARVGAKHFSPEEIEAIASSL